MAVTRRHLLKGAACLAAAPMAGLSSGCTAPLGTRQSYLTQVLAPRNYNVIFHWLDVIMQQVRDQRIAPPRAAYNFAMPLAAGFLAANSITRTYGEPYNIGWGPYDADPQVAYVAAFTTAASEVFQQPFVVERAQYFNSIPGSQAKSNGMEWGRKVGLKVVKMRTNDGSEPSEVNYYLDRYRQRDDALAWKPTGPFYSATPGPAFDSFARAAFPGHGAITPWTMRSGSQFRVPNFYHPASPEFAAEFKYIRDIGGSQSRIRTPEQSEIAMFWEDGPWGITPPGHFLYLAAQVLQHQPLSFIEQAKAFALLGMTQCDASICAWDNKYAHDIIRPESAIRVRAPQFQNPDPDVRVTPNWQSYIPTPNFPAYTSGHSTFGAAAAEMLTLILGRDDVPLSGKVPDEVIWPQLKGVVRHWRNIRHAAEENGVSRLYGGVHWELDHKNGMRSGGDLAHHAFTTMFPRIG